MDLTAGPPAPIGAPATGGAPIQRETGTPEGWFSGRLRSMFPWQSSAADPVIELVRTHRQIHSHADINLVRRSYAIAEQKHRGQMRKSGEPYITHPLAVAQILAGLGMDTTTLVAALLHDTVEDTSYTLPELREDFGPEVALLVDGVTKFDKVYYGETAEVETIRKMLVMAGQDVRVLVIKLADRLHNMRTLSARSPASRTRIAGATREVLVPLCDRLGIQALKRELEDSVLWNLDPESYATIDTHVRNRPQWLPYLSRVIGTIQPALAKGKITATISARPRHYYSIWKDAESTGREIPIELPRIVVVVDGTQTDCYAALGTVHTTWRPVPGRFKDFIASPKNNHYRSLHTTVLGPENQPLEVLIRTERMHREAEYGIVANFRYSAGATGLTMRGRTESPDWLRRVLDWEVVADDAERFLDALRCDLTEGEILVFTVDGRRIQLPAGSTPVDLAYTLDTDVGHGCVGARRGGRLIPLSSTLVEGDVVEIISQSPVTSGPSREWLEFVKTPYARLQIDRWFADGAEPSTIAHKVKLGRSAIGLALRKWDRGLVDDRPLLGLVEQMGYPDLEAMLVAIADHRLSAETAVETMIARVDQSPG